MTLLLCILTMVCGFLLGVCCAVRAVEKYYPTTWKLLLLEIKTNKQKRAGAAHDKEA